MTDRCWWLLPRGWRTYQENFAHRVEGRIPVPDYKDDFSFRIGPFMDADQVAEWAEKYPLYHGTMWQEGTEINQPVDPQSLPAVSCAYVENHWELHITEYFQYLERLKEGPVKELLRILIDS